ncbi:hypothetical protein MED222_05250 [Vibrio sp. MED222]|nr:hypothetical protein MED222_05250 [Vibrio sp. MED222]
MRKPNKSDCLTGDGYPTFCLNLP